MRVPQFAMLSAAAILALGVAVAPPSLASSAAGAGPAKPAVVLVNQPVKALCAGHKFTVGVWYQKFSGGSRAYRISIRGPRHLRFFYRSGMASAFSQSRMFLWMALNCATPPDPIVS